MRLTAPCLWNVQVSMYINVLQSFFIGVRADLGFIFGSTTSNRKGFRFSNALPVDTVILTAFTVCFKYELSVCCFCLFLDASLSAGWCVLSLGCGVVCSQPGVWGRLFSAWSVGLCGLKLE